MGRRLAATLLAGAVAVTGGCSDWTVSLAPHLEVGDRARYRYEIDATVTTTVVGGEPTTSEIATEIVADQRVVTLGDDGAEADVTLRRDGGEAVATRVRLDRFGAMRGVDLLGGMASETFASSGLGDLAPPSISPPERPLSVGARWTIDDRGVQGHGRLSRLGEIDGVRVATVATSVVQPVTDEVATGSGTATLEGRLRSEATTSYDVEGGTLRRSSGRSHGEVQATIQPPEGVDAAPVEATITFVMRVRMTRLA